MPDNVHLMPNTDIDPEVLLSKARKWGLTDVLVLGWDDDGNLVVGGSMIKLKDISWLLRCADSWVSDRLRDVE